jgi:hypothetical protein
MKDHQDDIDRYLHGTMKEQDQRSFLLLLDQDPVLREEFARQEKLADMIGLAAMQEELELIHAEMDTGSPDATAVSSPKRISRAWWLAAAAIMLLLAGRYFFASMSDKPEKKLFATWYQPEPGLPTLMGAGQNDHELMDAMVDYKTKDYTAAILKFGALLPARAQSPMLSAADTVALFYLASSYMAEGRLDSASLMFGRLAGPVDHYSRLAQWYEAMTCLGLGRKEEAESLLLKISSDPTHPYREKATKLATALGELPIKNN